MIITTADEVFTDKEHQLLAAFVYKRFGWDPAAAAAAWRRMMQNDCSDQQFLDLAVAGVSDVHRGLR